MAEHRHFANDPNGHECECGLVDRSPRCECCDASVRVAALFRANEQGVKARWRCEGCMGEQMNEVAPVVLAITDDVMFDNMRRRAGG